MRGKDQKAFWGVFTLAIVIEVLVGSYFFTGAITGQFFHGPPSTDSPDASSTSDSTSLTKGGGSKKVTYDGVLNMLNNCVIWTNQDFVLFEGEFVKLDTYIVTLQQVGSEGSVMVTVKNGNITDGKIIGPRSTRKINGIRITNVAAIYRSGGDDNDPGGISQAHLKIWYTPAGIITGDDVCARNKGEKTTCVSAFFEGTLDVDSVSGYNTVAEVEYLSCSDEYDPLNSGGPSGGTNTFSENDLKALCCTVP